MKLQRAPELSVNKGKNKQQVVEVAGVLQRLHVGGRARGVWPPRQAPAFLVMRPASAHPLSTHPRCQVLGRSRHLSEDTRASGAAGGPLPCVSCWPACSVLYLPCPQASLSAICVTLSPEGGWYVVIIESENLLLVRISDIQKLTE